MAFIPPRPQRKAGLPKLGLTNPFAPSLELPTDSAPTRPSLSISPAASSANGRRPSLSIGVGLNSQSPPRSDDAAVHSNSDDLYMAIHGLSLDNKDPNINPSQIRRRASVAVIHTPGLNGTIDEKEEEVVLAPELFKDIKRLGEGASGEVWKVLHIPTQKYMARKMIPASANPDVHKQLLRELTYNKSCRAEYIAEYYGAFMDDGDNQLMICMEFCEGGSLDAVYKRIKERQGRTGEKILGKVAVAVLRALVFLHEKKIIHRDIKPSNILVTRQGQIKLCDFGISGELVNSMAGTFCGTSYYMAPERIQGAKYTISSDIWSLGLTVHEIAMNRFPFPPEGEAPLGPIELLTYIIRMEPPKLVDDPEIGLKWTKGIQDFLRLCFDKNAQTRPTPNLLLQHPWIIKSEQRETNLAAWIASVWEWPAPAAAAPPRMAPRPYQLQVPQA